MKGKNENKLDQLFKDGLSGSEDHIAFREEDWTSMERLLDDKPSKKAGVARIIYYISGIAAILLLAIGLFLFNRDTDKTDATKNNLHTKNKTKNNGSNDQASRPFKDSVQNQQAGNESLSSSSVHHQKNGPGLPLPADRSGHYFPDNSKQNTVTPTPAIVKTNDSISNNNNSVSNNSNVVVDPSKIASTENKAQNNLVVTTPPDTTSNNVAVPEQQVKKQNKTSIKPILNNGPRFTLSILAAPDINAVNSFNKNQVGTNFGLQVAVRLSKKFSVSTGAAYAIKPYEANGSQYKTAFWQGKAASDLPNYIAANCKVLDIPLNINYQFYSKGKNAFALGTGLSSYIMLKENYHFDYAAGSGKSAYDIQIENQNKHWFGVLNLNATYERKINSKFSTIIQPYVKLPLTGIGNGRVDLKSTGVAVGISWNINSALKPR
ncbi:hypothetical protein [Mucilaginibacter pocheonensis]|uniref:Outer membrane protein beta-barrel domain-containing protein n=1 Tax=Mucilaginibacter pocheonensis TaxID=398050 RepID=A0ABU1TDA1_9SPHI|nr:hypothetical protein [Mucilaginibacter pocheonensis]MDR6943372.1 hypothetical protein [Mucilaginibacter pocheonensis]